MATDRELVKQVRRGECEAYAELFQKHYNYIYVICLSMVRNPQDAEELAQEMFVLAYLKLDQLRNPDRFFPWLKKMAHNRSRNYAQRTKAKIVQIPLSGIQRESVAPDGELLRRELMDAIMEAIQALSAKDRAVVQARIDGLNHAEISERLGISVQASISRLYRARRKLAGHLKGLYSIFGLSRILRCKEIISGGIVAMKIGTVAKIGIGIIGVLCIGFIGLRIIIYRPDAKPIPTMETGNERSQESIIEAAARVSKKTALDEQKLSDTSGNADAGMGDAPNESLDGGVSAEDKDAFIAFLDKLAGEDNKNSEPSEAERFRRMAAEARAKLEDLLTDLGALTREMLVRVPEAVKIRDDVEREAAIEVLSWMGDEHARLMKEIISWEADYANYAPEEWEEANKPGGWLHELKTRVRPDEPATEDR